ncbi:MAG: TerC/Alx family metal homeostasis membrane protein [Telmatospirillum sp.]|nr:TerC/Alx family metal homeostasis membrane protein [Telmatospirillum sp.]
MLVIAVAVVAIGFLGLDLILSRNHPDKAGSPLLWSGIWIGCALAFAVALLAWRGQETAVQFVTGYLIEFSLSVDNLFVFLLLFSQFAVPAHLQHRVLSWGVLGAVIMRIVMIAAGGALVEHFHWILWLFGAFLAVTGLKMLLVRDKGSVNVRPPLRWLSRYLPVSDTAHDGRFLVRIDGRRMVTPLFIALLSVEAADVMFAVDSIPAIFAVTTDPLVVATSNIFAILGLRSMYFVLAGFAERLRYLKHGLAVILLFIGARMLVADLYPVPVTVALGVTVGILSLAVIASLIRTRDKKPGSDRHCDSASFN